MSRDIDKYEKEYMKDKFEVRQVLFRRKKVLELLEQNSHRNILEVGCGLKPLFTDIEKFDTMTIVEPGKEFYTNAVEQAAKDGRKIFCISGFLETAVEQIQELNINYDYIIISGLLHGVEQPQIFLEAISKLANEETMIHINVPNANSIHRLIDKEIKKDMNLFKVSEKAIKKYQIQRVYDIDKLTKEVEACGFKVVESGTYFPKFFTHDQMQACLDNEIISDEVLLGIYHLGKYIPELGSELYVQCIKNVNESI